jgi:hypothetical protein
MKKIRAYSLLIVVVAIGVLILFAINTINNKKFVVYKIDNNINGIEYLGFSRNELSPEFVAEKILDGKYKTNSKEFTSLKEELGVNSGYVWHALFKLSEKSNNNKFVYNVDVRRISGEDIKRGVILSIPTTTKIPLKWPGWWGDGFDALIVLDHEMN